MTRVRDEDAGQPDPLDERSQVRLPIPGPSFGLERRFDPSFVATLALREKQVQQSYRPIISIHKWFARRPGSVFRGLMLAEYVDAPLSESYWQPHNLDATVADPFMGGGTSVFESLRLGMSAVGTDVNPMAYWLVRQAVEPLDMRSFLKEGEQTWLRIQERVGDLYRTDCTTCGGDAEVKYFLWVKVCSCPNCRAAVSLFPGYRVTEPVRHPRHVFHCPRCRELREIEKNASLDCPTCGLDLSIGNVKRGNARCTSCTHEFRFAEVLDSPPAHHMFGIEYQCRTCYPKVAGRQFKTPDQGDRDRVSEATSRLDGASLMLPDDTIPPGDETDRLHRWGYERYRELFTDRQLLGLGILLDEIRSVQDDRIREALATVFSDFLRYQNLLCRYDTYALKCQDIFSVHGYPVGLVACENNLPGIPKVGSGSFVHFVAKFAKAKEYAQRPYETRFDGKRKQIVHMEPERIEADLAPAHDPVSSRHAFLACEPSQHLPLAPASLDGVFTDPPYFANVQYAELMDFCFVWLRLLLGDTVAAFERRSTRTPDELTGNDTLGRGLANFTAGLSDVFCHMATALKPGAPLAFTYHHNDPQAYAPLVVAMLDANFTCTAVLPAPAEMAASLHIAGTKSSILDSVFVCRDRDWSSYRVAPEITSSTAERVERDVVAMADAGYSCTEGDRQCLQAGHIAGDAVRHFTECRWDRSAPLGERLTLVAAYIGAAVA